MGFGGIPAIKNWSGKIPGVRVRQERERWAHIDHVFTC